MTVFLLFIQHLRCTFWYSSLLCLQLCCTHVRIFILLKQLESLTVSEGVQPLEKQTALSTSSTVCMHACVCVCVHVHVCFSGLCWAVPGPKQSRYRLYFFASTKYGATWPQRMLFVLFFLLLPLSFFFLFLSQHCCFFFLQLQNKRCSPLLSSDTKYDLKTIFLSEKDPRGRE